MLFKFFPILRFATSLFASLNASCVWRATDLVPVRSMASARDNFTLVAALFKARATSNFSTFFECETLSDDDTELASLSNDDKKQTSFDVESDLDLFLLGCF